MNILVTGSKGFVGRNLIEALKNIKYGKDKTRSDLSIDEIFEFDVDSEKEDLALYCSRADFVFNLAGVNRPKDNSEFMQGNFGFASELLDTLKKCGNNCPVMLASSIQASEVGRYADGDYGKSKKAGEELFFDYSQETGAKILIYRFPNLYGKWCRPNYNSVVATFCYNIANDLPIRINNRATELEFLYIDDLIGDLIDALSGKEHRCDYSGTEIIENDNGKYCYVPVTDKKTLGEIADLLYLFGKQPETLIVPDIPKGSFSKKLYSTYLSYLPKSKAVISLNSNKDPRGSFTEILKTASCGQFSVNVSNPGITKGEHWHNSKWEFFIVVYGSALIRERKIGTKEVWEFEVNGEDPKAVHMLPGYTHSIINLSDTEKLITLMWANEVFDAEHTDTFFEKVE